MGEAAFDVLILGAGPAGCATALALRARGVERVLLVDRAPPAALIPGESATPDIAPCLAKLGLDGGLAHPGARPYHGNLSAWGGPPALSLFGRRGRGWHLDRTVFELWLRREAVSRGVVLACPARLDAISAHPDGWNVTVEGLGDVHACVVVDAAGRRAPLATRLGAKRHKLDDLVALAARVPCMGHTGFEGFSFVESFADGWWYAAHIPSGEAVVMLMTDRDIAGSYRDARAFAQAWRDTAELSRRLPPACRAAPRIFAAHGAFLGACAGERWIAVGDALMSFDPLASSGLSGAFNDAIAAADAILSMLSGDDPRAAYARRASAALTRYLAGHAAYYGLERRWPQRSFWTRRSSRPCGTGLAA